MEVFTHGKRQKGRIVCCPFVALLAKALGEKGFGVSPVTGVALDEREGHGDVGVAGDIRFVNQDAFGWCFSRAKGKESGSQSERFVDDVVHVRRRFALVVGPVAVVAGHGLIKESSEL